MDTAELEKNNSSKQSLMNEVKILVNKIYQEVSKSNPSISPLFKETAKTKEIIKVYKYLDENKKFDSQIAKIKLDELI